MGATTTLVTVQEFLELPEPEGEFIELIVGEVVSMPRAGQPHEVVKSNLLRLLILGLGQDPALRVFVEAAFQLDDRNCLIPDISGLSSDRIAPGAVGVFQGAPELAIEVVSSESAARLEQKIELYLKHGAGPFGWSIPSSALSGSSMPREARGSSIAISRSPTLLSSLASAFQPRPFSKAFSTA